jgi:hypothetical protein
MFLKTVKLKTVKWLLLAASVYCSFDTKAQQLLTDVGGSIGAGSFKNHYTTNNTTAWIAGISPVLQMNLWKRKIGLLTNSTLEYAFQQNKQSNTIQLDRAIYFTPGLRLNFTGNPLGKNLFIEYGFGVEQRLKINESNYWNVGGPVGSRQKFEKRYAILPFHFCINNPGKKIEFILTNANFGQ